MIIELAVPQLPVVKETSYHRKNLESIFRLGIVEHLEITDEEVREVIFRDKAIQIVLSEPENKHSNNGIHLERTSKALIDWIKHGGDIFDVFDFTLPPIKAVKKLYPASTRPAIQQGSAEHDLESMTLSKRDNLGQTVQSGDTEDFETPALEKITTKQEDLLNYKVAKGNYLVDELYMLLPAFNVRDIKVSVT